MHPIRIDRLSAEQHAELGRANGTARDGRLGAAGRLVLLYLLTYSPWVNPIEMLWRQSRREVTHCELFDSIEALLDATRSFFDRYNRKPGGVRSIIGAHPT